MFSMEFLITFAESLGLYVIGIQQTDATYVLPSGNEYFIK